MNTYVPLHYRSFFSLLRGCLSPEEVCRIAARRGYAAVGITDLNNMYGLMRFLNAANREGVRPVVGVSVAPGGRELFTAYIRNLSGFRRINGILSDLFLSDNSRRPNLRGGEGFDLPKDLLERGWDGLFLASDDLALLELLGTSGRKGLFVKLTFERPFGSLVRWARLRGFPLLAVNEGIYVTTEQRGLCNLLRAIGLHRRLDALPPAEKAGAAGRMAGAEEVERFFAAVPQALENTRRVALEASPREPLRPPPTFPRFHNMSDFDSYRLLRSLCLRGARERYARIDGQVTERLRRELAIIRDRGYVGYFLVVHDIVSRCRRTCGRGSSAASLVSYVLGITHVDPIRHGLYFERFLNRARSDPPDIDVDFPWDEREEVLRYVFRAHSGRAGMVATHVTFGPRASIRETSKAMGVEEGEIGRLIRLWRLGRDSAIPEFVRVPAARILGLPHYIGTHCAGVVITPGSILNHTHVQPSPQGFPIIAWDKEGAEDAGLVKIDLLGNRSLAVLRDAEALVSVRLGRAISWDSIKPLEDRETRCMIGRGETVGIFYIESPATRQLLKKMRRGDYSHLVVATSIIRPASAAQVRRYVQRLNGIPYDPLHPKLKEVLRETYGILVYQEDVSRVAEAVGGFSPEAAELLRKSVARLDGGSRLPALREDFFAGGRSRGFEDGDLEEIWSMILSFRGYSFCKAHSASFALLAFKLAYLKGSHPLEFFVSVINNGGGFYSTQTYLNECRRHGIAVRGPDVNRSAIAHTAEESGFRVGLGQIEGLPHPFLRSLVEKRRRGGEFRSTLDFIARCRPSFSSMRALIASGALDSLSEELTRPQLFWLFLNSHKLKDLFLVPPVPRLFGDYSADKKLLDEVRTLGLVISRHPLEIFRSRIRSVVRELGGTRLQSSKEIPQNLGKPIVLPGMLATAKEVRTSRNEQMTFVSFEDAHAIFETVFYPKAFRKYFPLLDQVGVFLISGRVENDMGALSVNVERLTEVVRTGTDPCLLAGPTSPAPPARSGLRRPAAPRFALPR
jgi:error-prone DNA polymerase